MKKSKRLVTAELQKNKKCHIVTIFPVLGKLTHICCGERYLRRQNPQNLESKSVVSDGTCSGLGRQQFWPQFRIFTFVTTKVLSRLLFRWKWIKSESLVSVHHGQWCLCFQDEASPTPPCHLYITISALTLTLLKMKRIVSNISSLLGEFCAVWSNKK